MWNQGLVCFWQIREKGDESQTSLWFHAKFSTQSVHTLVRKMFLLFLSSSAATIVSHRKPVLRSGLASNFPNSDSSLKRVSDRHSVSVRQCVCMCVCSASDSHTHTHTHIPSVFADSLTLCVIATPSCRVVNLRFCVKSNSQHANVSKFM